MFKARRDRRRRAKERARANAIFADAKTASEAARRALREAHGSARGNQSSEDQIGDAIQAAILGSVLPSVAEAVRQPTATGSPHRPSNGGGLLFLTGLGAGIGLAAWARRESQPTTLAAQDDEWELASGANARAAKDAINTTLERLDLTLRRGVKAAAEAMGSTASVLADATAPTAEKVTGQLKVARSRAAAEVIRALDDVDDVWGDDGDDAYEPSTASTTPKKPSARRPVEGKPTQATTTKASTTKKSPARATTTSRPRKTTPKPPKAAD
jgi:hypothetical protein